MGCLPKLFADHCFELRDTQNIVEDKNKSGQVVESEQMEPAASAEQVITPFPEGKK